jgi:hypothetical protein
MVIAGFYLIINLSVGGTSGWFPDEVGEKPWYDGSTSEFPLPDVLLAAHGVLDNISCDAGLCKGAGPVVRDVANEPTGPRV